VSAVRAGAVCDLRGVVVDRQLLRELMGDRGDRAITFDRFMADQATFLGPADFSGCRFGGETSFEGAVFRGPASFDEVLFDDAARFTGVRFLREVTFDSARFAADARFDRAQFKGAGFECVQFDGVAWFEATTWRGRGTFIGASFVGVAWFTQASFDGRASFDDAKFAREVSFDRSSFGSRASFARCTFGGLAMFMDAGFADDVSFDRSVFAEEVRFNRAELRADAVFSAVQFRRPVWLEAVTVGRQAHFEHCRLTDQVHLADAHFAGGLWLSHAEFAAANDVGPLRAGPFLDLDNAVFGHRVRLSAKADVASAVDCRFLQGGDLRLVGAEVVLDGAILGGPTNVVGTRPDGNAGRRTRLLSVRRMDVANLRLVETDLGACLFDGAHNLDQVRIEGSDSFATSPLPRRWRFGQRRLPLFPRWTVRKTVAEEHHWRATHARRFEAGGSWNPPETRTPQWIAEHTGVPVAVVSPDRIAEIYRSLRKAHEDAKNEPGAADFYYGEMEMRRHSPATSFAERLILHAYWLVSGYGLRAWRAMLLLLAMLVVHGFLFASYGFASPAASGNPDYGFWSGYLYALNMLLLSPDSSVRLTLIGQLLRISLRVTGPLLLGLALLAVRNRVKR